MEPWQPRVVAFCCNWCAYAGADLAGVSRRQYSPSVRIVRVMCSSRIDAGLILQCFEKGADGVMVLGCHPGDCHYISGNQREEMRVQEVWELLDLLGIGRERLVLKWISAAEGELFGSTVDSFVTLLQSKGPVGRVTDGP
ncbi:MAG: hydrogenase iron-sulfur subunit [Methanomassiliicoccus sp.]|nr:hydrogenase iron-sulfur subunit [Methanomassiliicoccus sp.]